MVSVDVRGRSATATRSAAGEQAHIASAAARVRATRLKGARVGGSLEQILSPILLLRFFRFCPSRECGR